MMNWVKINDGHDNFFTPLRFLFAFMVLIGHAFVISAGGPDGEPRIFYDFTFSYLAVNLFFIASGFLVTKSMLYRADVAEYSSARILRIYPALALHVLFVMFIMGPFVTNLPAAQFYTDPQFWTQPLQVLSFYETNMELPGALENNTETLASATLWTLRYEVLAYIATAALFAMGFMRERWMLLAQFVLCAAAWMIVDQFGLYDKLPATGKNLLRFGICYGLGAAIFAYRDVLKFNFLGLVIVTIAAFLTNGTFMFEITTAIMLAYFVFWAAYIDVPKLKPLQKISDISYGIYIYHWAVMQWIIHANPNMSTLNLILIASPITILLSAASWRYVEKPMLSSKKSFAERLRFNRKKARYDGRTLLVE